MCKFVLPVLLLAFLRFRAADGQYVPANPCPNVFQFVQNGGQIMGRIILPNDFGGRYSIQVNVSYAALLNQNIQVKLLTPAQEVVNGAQLTYNVLLPTQSILPKVTQILYNGRVVCSGPAENLVPGGSVSSMWAQHELRTSVSNVPQGAQRPPFSNISPFNQRPGPPIDNNEGDFDNNDNFFTFQNPDNNPNNGNNGNNFNNNNFDNNPFINEQFGQPLRPSQPQPPQTRPPPVFPTRPPQIMTRPPPRPIQTRPPPRPIQTRPPTPPPQTRPTLPPVPTNPPAPPAPPPKPPTAPPAIPDNSKEPFTSPPRISEQSDTNYNECGVSGSQPLVFGGTDVRPGEFPWLVAIFQIKGANYEYICTGNLVSNKHVLTAAHCLLNQEPSNIICVMGTHNITKWVTAQAMVREALTLNIHPSYNSSGISSDGDAAVIILKTPVAFQRNIRPICPWKGDDDLQKLIGKDGLVVGWGKSNVGNEFHEVPQRISMPVVSTASCSLSAVNFFSILSDRTFCAGKRDNTGPCTGDSGAGFMVKMNDRWTVRGIVSRSLANEQQSCNLENYIVFADLAKLTNYINFILTL